MGLFEGGLGTMADSAETTKYKRPLCKIGSIVRVTYGEQLHKLATVVNIVDAGRLLVEGPENLTGIARQIMPLKRVSLTGLGWTSRGMPAKSSSTRNGQTPASRRLGTG